MLWSSLRAFPWSLICSCSTFACFPNRTRPSGRHCPQSWPQFGPCFLEFPGKMKDINMLPNRTSVEAQIAAQLPPPSQALHQPPPIAESRPVTTINSHGDTMTDDYAWLHDRANPAVLDYVAKENAYTKNCLQHTKRLQRTLFREFVSKVDEAESTARVSLPDGWTYYARRVPRKEYRQHVRERLDPVTGQLDSEVYLDENELATIPEFASHTCFRLGCLRHSPCGRWVALAIDTVGNERYTFLIYDLHGRKLLPTRIKECWEDWEFSSDGDYGYYLAVDAADRAYRVMLHKIATDDNDPATHSDQILWEETDDMFYLTMSKSADSSMIVVHSAAQVTSETRVIDLALPAQQSKLSVVFPRSEGVTYSIGRHENHIYVLTNEGTHKNNWLFRVPLSDTAANEDITGASSLVLGPRETVLSARGFVFIEDFAIRAGHLAVFERSNCIQNVRVIDLKDPSLQTFHYLSFPEKVYAVFPMTVSEEVADLSKQILYHSATLRYTYTSLTQPKQVVDYDCDKRTFTIVHEERVGGPIPYNPALYASQRVFAVGDDGTAVPMSLVYRRDLVLSPSGMRRGPSPLLLHAYAAYGSCQDPIFSTQRLSLLDRGFIYAIAHVRGGADLGNAWYEDGKLDKKVNTFKDFIACIQFLIKEGYTSPDQLAIYGRSAGGLLIGNIVNEVPHLVRAALTEVPFVDVLNTMSDPTLPWTTFEYEEWGNPADPKIYRCMKGYCPYTNVESKEYPHMMVVGGMNDPRVSFFEPLKWVAKLRKHKKGDQLLLLRIDNVGHGGSGGAYSFLEDLAQEYAFLIYTVGASLMSAPLPMNATTTAATSTGASTTVADINNIAALAFARGAATVMDSLGRALARPPSPTSQDGGSSAFPLHPLPPPLLLSRSATVEDMDALDAHVVDEITLAHHAYQTQGRRGNRNVSRIYNWLANFF
ncbi:prolyl oligopeptidase family-domain-containing protein [Blastocladiella britannica]|nr:prolyl oligopeptidase family-domain-containing protein [Blastocladiella britannica]